MSSAYCHFTSPIRRYPDLVVHRALLASLGAREPAEPASELPNLGAWCSARERAADAVERRGAQLALAHRLEEQLAGDRREAFAGEITGMIGAGVFVRFRELYEGFLPIRRLGHDYYDLGPLGVDLIGRTSGHRIKLGDPVWVRVEQIEAHRGRVTLEPVDPSGRGGTGADDDHARAASDAVALPARTAAAQRTPAAASALIAAGGPAGAR